MGENCVEVAIAERKMRDVRRVKFDVQVLLFSLLTSFGELRFLKINADDWPWMNLPCQSKRNGAWAAACVQQPPARQQLGQKESCMALCCTLFHKTQDWNTVSRCITPILHFGTPCIRANSIF